MKMAAPRCGLACVLIPRAAVLSQPFKDSQVAALGREGRRLLAPRTSRGSQPPEHIQVTTLRCTGAALPVPGQTLAPQPLQGLQLTSESRVRANPLVGIPALCSQPKPLQRFPRSLECRQSQELAVVHNLQEEDEVPRPSRLPRERLVNPPEPGRGEASRIGEELLPSQIRAELLPPHVH